MSSALLALEPERHSSRPSWKISTRAPNVALTVSRFISEGEQGENQGPRHQKRTRVVDDDDDATASGRCCRGCRADPPARRSARRPGPGAPQSSERASRPLAGRRSRGRPGPGRRSARDLPTACGARIPPMPRPSSCRLAAWRLLEARSLFEHDDQGCRGFRREALADLLVHGGRCAPAAGSRRVRAGQLHAQEREARDQHQRGHRGRDQDGVAHHRWASRYQRRRRWGSRPPATGERVDPLAQHGQHGRAAPGCTTAAEKSATSAPPITDRVEEPLREDEREASATATVAR